MNSNETMIETNETVLAMSPAERKRQKGVTTVEYAVMLVLVAIAVATATPNISAAVKQVFTDVIAVL
jgi:Flp pilus assembly pilin Flp